MTSGDASYETAMKGSTVRGIVTVLQREGTFAKVSEIVTPRARDLLERPPPATAWVAFDDISPLHGAIESAFGANECRRISREAVSASLVPILQSVIGGLIRLFGSSPHTILSRVPQIMRVFARGVDYRYTRIDERACRVRVVYPACSGLSLGIFEAIAGGLETVFPVCKVEGRIGPPRIVPDGRSNAADFDIKW